MGNVLMNKKHFVATQRKCSADASVVKDKAIVYVYVCVVICDVCLFVPGAVVTHS